MHNSAEVKAFLSARRARISPEQAGLTSYRRNRRVPGLRRGEVADLAGSAGDDGLRLLAGWGGLPVHVPAAPSPPS
ncbi:hypothetical protein [Actinoplanes sp. NPDC051494]|uniref:hypothetical protein n=1 Tax=Actinoplanes sp. NPDC051494 TaxID=3363907 RepID=UPI00378E0486